MLEAVAHSRIAMKRTLPPCASPRADSLEVGATQGGLDPSQWREAPLHPGQEEGPVSRTAIELVSNDLYPARSRTWQTRTPISILELGLALIAPFNLKKHLGASTNP